MKQNPLFFMAQLRKEGIAAGIPSWCTANKFAIEAVMQQSKRFGDKCLIEATSNQVNQFGGYTGMQPADYRDMVYAIADSIGFNKENLILAGDHLGPQPFQNQPEKEAMENSKEMVRQYVAAGYTKIHLDTSMRVADDDRNQPLSVYTVARRGAELMKVCEETYQQLLKSDPHAMHPVFIIGSEVPIPGGAQVEEEMMVTRPEDFASTVKAYTEVFNEYGIGDLMKYVIAVVVQPGVEFGDADVHMYDRYAARELSAKLADFPDFVFEGHSTDYQSPMALKQMVEDGIAILKVGPALTFAAREALYALAHIEQEIIEDASKRSNLIQVIEDVMMENTKNWAKYYNGSELDKALKRKYSYSDRSRYYMGDARIEAAIEVLFANIRSVEVPMGMLHQYMPLQYRKVRDGVVKMDPKALVIAAVTGVCDDYNYATKHNYQIGGIFE